MLPAGRANPTGCRHSWELEHSFGGSQGQGTGLSGSLTWHGRAGGSPEPVRREAGGTQGG